MPHVRGGMSVDRAVVAGSFFFLPWVSIIYFLILSSVFGFILIGFVLHHLVLFWFIFVCLFSNFFFFFSFLLSLPPFLLAAPLPPSRPSTNHILEREKI